MEILAKLNKNQKQAALITDGPELILAGAGSGKTRVLVAKVINLIVNHKVDPEQIVMITFTNKAAKEMKSEKRKTKIPKHLKKRAMKQGKK